MILQPSETLTSLYDGFMYRTKAVKLESALPVSLDIARKSAGARSAFRSAGTDSPLDGSEARQFGGDRWHGAGEDLFVCCTEPIQIVKATARTSPELWTSDRAKGASGTLHMGHPLVRGEHATSRVLGKRRPV